MKTKIQFFSVRTETETKIQLVKRVLKIIYINNTILMGSLVEFSKEC